MTPTVDSTIIVAALKARHGYKLLSCDNPRR